MSAKTAGCVVDTALLLEFYRHSTGADYFPESATIVRTAIQACEHIAVEFVHGLSRFQEILDSNEDLLLKIKLLSPKEADALLARLSELHEAELTETVGRVSADEVLQESRSLRGKQHVRSLDEEIGYILRLALLAVGLNFDCIMVAEDRFAIVEAVARLRGIEAKKAWRGELEGVDAVVAGKTITFVTLPRRSLGGVERGYSLILRGGGIKGLAYAGALQELERYFAFDRYVGTSAGAITACLLGAGWKPEELEKELADLQLRKLVSLNPLTMIWNLVFRGGLFEGRALEHWVEGALRRRLGLNRTVTFGDLVCEVQILVSTARRGAVVFGRRTHPQVSVAYAARCSSSIPFFFVPERWEGEISVDGGVQNNLPVRPYFEHGGDSRVLIVTLESGADRNAQKGSFQLPLVMVGRALLKIWLGQDEEDLTRRHASSVITINTGTISAARLTITDKERRFLVASGRIGALRFLEKTKPDLAARRAQLERALEEDLQG